MESPRGQPVLHPNIDDALASGFASLVGRAPYATQLWLDDAAGFTARWDTDGDGAVDAAGVRTQTARFTKPGVYEPSVTLSAPGRPDVTLRQRIVVLGDAPAAERSRTVWRERRPGLGSARADPSQTRS